MTSNIYNEGRVVGYSAYEIYVRHAMSEGMQPVSEKEWLLSTLTEGSSLLMRLTSTMLDRDGNALSTAGSHIVDIPLPTAPSRYEVTTREPSDWSAYFTRYYTRSGIAPNYTYTQITTEPIPTWAQNKYYTRIPPDTYRLQESQPANWATNWSYAYTRSGVAPNYIYTPATSWEPNKYYRTVVTHLIAANTIVASLFLGNGVYENGSYWASHVGNYGQLLGNTTPLPTSTYKDAEDVEPIGSYDFPTQATKMLLYANITDGIIITPGTWSPSSTTPPGNDFVPDLSDSAGQQVVRLYINNPITQTIQILLTGFLLKSTLEGMTDTTNGSINTLNPEDGDFLGPAVFPWANKIIFSTPNSFVDFIYNRKLIIDGVTPPTGTEVINKSIIDADTEGLRTYYGNGTAYNSAVHSILSSGKNASDDVPYEVLTIYSRKSVLPPALYVSQVDEAVERGVSAYPVDTVAPGTVKIFNSDGRLADAKDEASAVNQITGNVGMYRDTDYIIHQTVPTTASDPTDPISDVEVIQSATADRTDLQGENSFIVEHTSGKKSAESISLLDDNGDELNRLGNDGLITPGPAGQPGFTLTTQEPNNWESLYMTYYLHYTTYPYYRRVSKVEYGLTMQEPDDWDQNWSDYYERIGTPPYVSYAALVTKPAPTWEEGKYYSPNGPAWQSNMYYRRVGNSYQLTTAEPGDWASDWQSYYQVDEDVYWTTWYKPVVPASYTLVVGKPGGWSTVWEDYYVESETGEYVPATNWEPNRYYQHGSPQEFIPIWEPNAYYATDSSYEGTLHWNDLMYALSNNKSIDLFNTKYFQNRVYEELALKILHAGPGISIQYNPSTESGIGTIDIINTAVDTSKLPVLDASDYTVLYQYQDGCCGKFAYANKGSTPSQNFKIKYSPAKQGVPASIYISSSSNNYLMCTDFSRDASGTRPIPSIKLETAYSGNRPRFYPDAFWEQTAPDTYIVISTKPANWDTSDDWKDYYKVHNEFWFRHTDATTIGKQLSRMVRIKLNFDNVVKGKTLAERLNLTSITSISDMSESSTGIWNVGAGTSVEDELTPVGASWQASCKVESCDNSSFFVYGISYADGWNTQVGASALTVNPSTITIPGGGGSVNVSLTQAYPHGVSSQDNNIKLMSNHINLKVSAMLWGTLYEDSI